MKNFFKSKKGIISSVILAVIVLAAAVGVSVHSRKPEAQPVNETQTVAEITTEKVTEKTAEPATEKATEPAATQENKPTQPAKPGGKQTGKQTGKTTKPKNNTPSKPKPKAQTQGKKQPQDDKIPAEWVYELYGGKAGYENHLENVRNNKCPYCGKHDCPSITYGPDSLGNLEIKETDSRKCPALRAGKVKCPHCGKTMLPYDDSRLNDKEHYCNGACNVHLG